jgi:hypothetical protein
VTDSEGRGASAELLCPSAPGKVGGSLLIGVVTQSSDGARVRHTERPIPVTQEILDLAAPVRPSEVFRFATPCQASKCVHFSGNACQLALRSVDVLQPVTDDLPPCSIRPVCRWFRQQGATICRRCPQIVTDQYRPAEEMLRVVYGSDPPPDQPTARAARHE